MIVEVEEDTVGATATVPMTEIPDTPVEGVDGIAASMVLREGTPTMSQILARAAIPLREIEIGTGTVIAAAIETGTETATAEIEIGIVIRTVGTELYIPISSFANY